MMAMKHFALRLLKNPLPWILVGMHGVVILTLAPLMLLTVNTETAPLGFVVIGYMDLPVYLVAPEWIVYPAWFGSLSSAGLWSFVLFPFFAGSIQWFTLGLILAIPEATCLGRDPSEAK